MDWALPQADSYFKPLLTELGFQVEHLLAALPYVTNWRVAVDGGAHVGTWTVAMARRFQTVWAFEPAADAFSCLRKNIESARVQQVVEPQRVALGDAYIFGKMVDDPTRKGNTGARYLDPCGVGDVMVRPLDSYKLEGVGLLKLDLEGFECYAINGAMETIKRCRPVVVIEEKRGMAERFGIDFGAASRLLESYGAKPVGGVRNDRIFVFDHA